MQRYLGRSPRMIEGKEYIPFYNSVAIFRPLAREGIYHLKIRPVGGNYRQYPEVKFHVHVDIYSPTKPY